MKAKPSFNRLLAAGGRPLSGRPATDTRLMQYRLPVPSGRLCPKWVPSALMHSPLGNTRTCSQFTSESRKEDHPWTFDSLTKDDQVTSATKIVKDKDGKRS